MNPFDGCQRIKNAQRIVATHKANTIDGNEGTSYFSTYLFYKISAGLLFCDKRLRSVVQVRIGKSERVRTGTRFDMGYSVSKLFYCM
jgi:hypothetical protein